MGISDRDYMRDPRKDEKIPTVRPHIKPAENRPSLRERLRFWIWNLNKRK